MNLYKYTNIKNAKLSLKERYIYMSSPANFNDIYDSILGYKEEDIKTILIGELCNRMKISGKTYLDIAKRAKIFSDLSTETAKDRYNFMQFFLKDENFGFLRQFGEVDQNESIDQLVERSKKVLNQEPNECDLRAVKLMRKFNFLKFTNKLIKNNKVGISKMLNIINSRELKISCLTEDNKSNYMWALYAANFKGVCLEYDYEIILEEAEGDIYQIKYDKIKPLIATDNILGFLDGYDNAKQNLENDIISTITTKSIEFEKEREWRIIKLESSNKFYTKSLKNIYLGYKISKKDMKYFKKIAVDNQIDIFQIKIQNDTFQISFDKIAL